MGGALPSNAYRAINTARATLHYLTAGPPIIERLRDASVRVDVPLLYNGFAVDRVHIDPRTLMPSPKGFPPRVYSEPPDTSTVTRAMEEIIGELRVLEAAEYRGPERAWAVPLAWRPFIVAHIKVRDATWEIVPDHPLTEELRRRLS